ncbi:Maf-like protein [Pseudohoeflea coraliihabitans]|uniref:7-methyl-GTP pyrophosphatase n=1 Tax=Pseudohoeflea coraliihabitans TaxID=2860393 RepID=A0ABS6WT67_9HYPH|nr:Maf-like protein [Pseudohoeflea sp. DP4N28-3]MBW3099136.1 Maf-like protein [Pseudohoeflea sp. DP4N28-3]
MTRIILASQSTFRRDMLANAGIDVTPIAAEIDERAVERTVAGSGVTPDELALILAEAKASNVAERNAGAWTIGCDQTLALDDLALHKPVDMDGARRRLLELSGKTHQLHSAVVLARGSEVVWRHLETARLTMRELDPGFIGRHLANVGDKVLESVGAYQIEGEGVQLFESIEGDLFTIIGLPLLPLLAELRRLGAIDG